ncbi:zinc finger protein 628-like [Homarus americanus]|uniref:Charlatan-like n=1 Tax=Homarus americanus TaxID=6706 RepID=A0A8J5N696_HOMAM|nr:zinc finger protein 628-like [Homarus americanus]KAG7173992.1 charlatan-like [Homarus americanus]
MRTNDVMNQTAAATAGMGTSLLALGGAITAATAKGSTLAGVSPSHAFDLTAYTQLFQMAAKVFPYDPASVAASLAALSPASHLPLALTAPHALSLTTRKTTTNVDKTTMTSACSLPDSDIKIAWQPSEKSDIKIKVEDGESALDLRTQGLKSLYSSFSRATLDDIKPKVVDDIWIENDLRLSWTDSRIAAYNPAQKLFMCVDCECVGFLSRVAEHWLGAHANLRVFACPRCPYTSAWSRCVKMHLTRQHNEQFADTNMWKENATLIEVTRLMQELRNKVENRIDSNSTLADKRFYCPHCPYATDRRDLYTRHENIHKDDKPFHCYLCFKQFNRADHVKKHFVRMHPETEYDISKIRKQPGSGRGGGGHSPPSPIAPVASIAPIPLEIPPTRVVTPIASSPPVVTPPVPSPPTATPAVSVADLAPLSAPSTPGDCSPASPGTMMGMGLSMMSGVESPEPGRGRRRGERAYTCPYCHWSGSDNWCLKRHMNTHIKPFACVMCDYKAARAERLSTHVWKVHNKRICNKCNFLAETQERLLEHTREEHHNNPYSRRYICSSCGLTFDTRPALETHQHLSHPRLTNSTTAVPPIPAVQDVAHDLSVRSEINCTSPQASSPLVCPVDGCGHTVGSGGALAEHVRGEHGGAGGSCCPHCGYQLTHDELSRDHWLTHHNEVCAACVHVFTAVYGPQLWKKVHVRPASLESPLDAIVTGLNRKRTATDIGPIVPSVITPLALISPSSIPQRDSPSPDSDQQDTDSERFNKRSRKQSCPKKVITVEQAGSNSGSSSNSLRRRSSLRTRCRAVLNRPGFTSRQCHRCPRRPVFASRARLQLHVKWSHGRHNAGRRCQPHRDHPLPVPATVH